MYQTAKNMHAHWQRHSFSFCSKSTNIHQSKTVCTEMSFNSQFKEIKGQTFYRFEIISLAIKYIVFLYLLKICTFQ